MANENSGYKMSAGPHGGGTSCGSGSTAKAAPAPGVPRLRADTSKKRHRDMSDFDEFLRTNVVTEYLNAALETDGC